MFSHWTRDIAHKMIGTLLNKRYKLETEIGHGGMGVVYRGHDTLLDRDIAVKVLSSERDPSLGPEVRARLLNEAKAAAQLNHPNIVSIYDAGEDKGQSYIVMELIAGHSLHELSILSYDETIAITMQVCEALNHAHANGIVHRDLKPENILITLDGIPKLTDFGLARSLVSRMTLDGMVVGTVFYMAPELAMGRDYDGRVDQYSLGVILYELTTGRLPFSSDDPLSVISQHVHAPIIPPRTYSSDLPLSLEAIILKLLAKNPNNRFTRPHEISLALEEVMVTEETKSAPIALEITDTVALLDQLASGRLVGRQKELSQLRELWSHTQQGHTQMALISGEPGVGKTRLANEMLVYAQLSRAVVLRGGCYEYEATTPYVPLVEALREWVHTQNMDELREQLGSLAGELSKFAPEIETKLGALEPSPPLPPDEERLRLFDNIARFLQHLAISRGLLLFIDDLHWADQGTLSLLHYLLRNLRNDPMMMIAAYREVELDRAHPLADALVEWNRERLVFRISLNRLSQENTASMLRALFGTERMSDEFIAAIFSETDGNPFFVEEVIKALIDQGQIYRVSDQWEREEINDLTIPQSVKEAIGRRLNKISESTVETLHCAATLGKSFNFFELDRVCTLNEDQLLDALDEASAAQLIRPESGESFVFTHDNIREVLYEEINPIRRRRHHQLIGESLEVLYEDNLTPHLQDIAHHYIESGDLIKGLHYSVQAAEKAEQLHAYEEALVYYHSALECAVALDQSDQMVSIYEAIGKVYYQHGPFQKGVEAFQRALELSTGSTKRAELKTWIGVTYTYVADESGLEYLQAALRELDPTTQKRELARATAMIGRFHHYQGRSEQAIDFLERARQLVEPLEDVSILTEVYGYLAGAFQQTQPQQIELSNEWARQSIVLGEKMNFPHAIALGYEFLAENAFIVGDWNESLHYAALDEEIGKKIGSQGRVAWAAYSRAYAYHGKGDLIAANEAAILAQAIAETIGDNRLAIAVRAKRATIEIDLGEDEAADKNVEIAYTRAQESGQVQPKWWCYFALAYIATAHEDWDQVLDIADKWSELFGNEPFTLYLEAYLGKEDLESISRMMKSIGDLETMIAQQPLQNQATAWCLAGRISTAQGNYHEAISFLDKAIMTFDELDSRLDLGRTIYHRGKLSYEMSQVDQAREKLNQAMKIFEKCGAKHDAEKVRGLLKELTMA